MNQKIEFKKDCIMKTMVSEITDISLSHDYKILDDMIEGYFDVSGEYKITKASTQREDFMYTIPFSIALSSLIDKSSINLTINDFNYSVEKDILHLKMALNMDYEEIKIPEPILETEEEIEEEEGMDTVDEILESIPDIIEENEETVFHNELMIDDKNEEVIVQENEISIEEKKETEASIQNIISNMSNDESYYKYKVYIMREEDTIESVAIKYNVSLDDLRQYNDIENINIGDKIVVPFVNVNAEE